MNLIPICGVNSGCNSGPQEPSSCSPSLELRHDSFCCTSDSCVIASCVSPWDEVAEMLLALSIFLLICKLPLMNGLKRFSSCSYVPGV